MAGKNVIEVNEANFEAEVVKSTLPVLVDFWAPWCAPCKMIAPLIDQLADKYAGKVRFAKVNIDNNQGVAQKYRITGIPTLLGFKGGKEAARIVGANAKAIEAAVIEMLG